MKKYSGTFLLLIATVIWGAAFVAQSVAADNIPAFTFNSLRCFLGATALAVFLGIHYAVHRAKKKKPPFLHPQVISQSVRTGVICGVILFFTLNFQQFGIGAYPAQVAASGRTGFIMATYVVMVAIYAWIRSKKFNPLTLLSTAGCTAGMYLLCFSEGFSGLYWGDGLIFLSAICYAIYILFIDRYGRRCDGIVLSLVQFVISGALSAVCMLLFEPPQWDGILAAWVPLAYTGILSGGLGYTLQILAQKRMSPTAASIVMSLESVFAALFGWIILSETLSLSELIGCALLFVSVLISQLSSDTIRKR